MAVQTSTSDAQAYYIGYTTDTEDRYKASSGGIGTAITRYLLLQSEFGTSVTFEFSQEKCMYVPKLIYSTDEINVCGSIYHDIDIARFIAQNIKEINEGLVVTCPPCQVSAIRQICKKNGIKVFVISYCCSGQTTIEGTWKYYELLGIDKKNIAYMQYRGNGWPSGIQIYLKNGNKIYHENYTEPWTMLHKSWLYRPQKCFFCKRETGRNADISLADPWLDNYKNNDAIGNTMFLTFSEEGRHIVESMYSSGLINYVESNYNEFTIAQTPNIHKEVMVMKHIIYLKRLKRLISNRYYWQWATSSRNNIQLHIAIMGILKRTESSNTLIKSLTNLCKKAQNKIQRLFCSNRMRTFSQD